MQIVDQKLFTGSYDATMRVWDLEELLEAATSKGRTRAAITIDTDDAPSAPPTLELRADKLGTMGGGHGEKPSSGGQGHRMQVANTNLGFDALESKPAKIDLDD